MLWCCMKWFEMFHYCFDDVATFVSVFQLLLFPWCNICISMFQCVFRECCGCWVSMLQTCDVGCCVEGEGGGPSCLVLQTLNFNVMDVEFRCYWHMMLVLYRGGGGGGLLMLDVARNTGRHIFATWEEEGGGPLIFGCCTQPTRNIARNGSQHLLPGFESDGWRLIRSLSDGHGGVRC
jgi:hypothetical protein